MDLERMTREELIAELQVLLRVSRQAAAHEEETARLAHELRVHQADLEMQNRELREVQRELEVARDRFQEMYDFAPAAYFTFDRQGRVQEVNLTGATLVGRERVRIVGRPFLELVRVVPAARFWEHLDRCCASRRPAASEMNLITKRHGEVAVQVATAPVLDRDGLVVGFRTSFTDITRLKRAEAALEAAHRTEQRLREGFEALDCAFVDLSRRLARADAPSPEDLGRIVAGHAREIAQAEYALFAAGEDAEGRFAVWVASGMDPAREMLLGPRPRARGVLGLAARTGRPMRLADLRTHPAFQGFPQHHPEMRSFLAVPVCAGGEPAGHIFLTNRRWGSEFTAADQWLVELLAERAGIALEIARLGAEVRSAVRARDDVLAAVAHDLRNPLSAICLSAAQLARTSEGPDAERRRRKLDVIQRAAERMVTLIGALLDAATIEAGTFTVEARPEPVGPLLEEVVAAHEPIASARSIHLGCEAPPDLPPILCDRPKLLQVFANLIGNALKFTGEGGRIEIRARALDGEVQFEVVDDGPGIAEEKAVHLFERFWKGQRERAEGVGLGLYIVHGIVEAHGGAIGVDTAPGAGSTFRFTVPSAGEPEAAAGDAP